MSVYNLFPQPFVCSALPLHSRSLLRETVPTVCSLRRPFQASLYARFVRGIGLFPVRIAPMMRLSQANPFIYQGA